MEPLEPGDPHGVGPYRIVARVGAGGMATVYLGQSRGGRAVAVKVVHAAFAQEPFHRDRFRSEVTAAVAVGGMHSPPVLEADTDAATPWMATEFLPSVSLREAVERFGPLPADSVLRLASGLAEALAAFHRTGIVHLDVKPANVLLTVDGPRLIDFGIAATAATAARSEGPAGSLGFMSPEQMTGDAGPPSDVYSLAATVQYARGAKPADGLTDGVTDRSAEGLADEAAQGLAEGPADRLDAILAECRRVDPADRPTAAELTRRLASLTAHQDHSGAPWLPPPVMMAIDAQVSAAVNPPTPLPRPLERRRLLAGGVAVMALAGAGGIAALLAGAGNGDGDPPDKPVGKAGGKDTGKGGGETRNAVPAGPPSPSPTAKPVVLELSISGDGPLSSLTYAVNGRLTTLKNVPLTWKKTVEVPRSEGSVDWRLRFTFPSGEARIRVLRDGSEVNDETYPLPAARNFPDLYPHDVDLGGSAAFAPWPDDGAGGSADSGAVPDDGV